MLASILLGALLPAAPALANPDLVAPTFSNLQVTDCLGNFQSNASQTSTGTVNIRITAYDLNNNGSLGSGLRFGTTEHVGGIAATTHLIVFQHLDDAGSGTAVSSDTYGSNNGTVSAGLKTRTCGSGGGFTGLAGDDCYNWNGPGSGDQISIPASRILNNTTAQMTLQAWINPADLTAAPILEWNSTTQPGVHLWHSFPSNNGELFANLIDTQGVSHVVVSSAGFVHAGQWQLVTLTYDGVSAKLFNNEVMIASHGYTNLPPLATGFPLYVGRRPSAANTFHGKIDEVRVYDQALPDSTMEGDTYSGLFFNSTSTVVSTQKKLQLTAGNYSVAPSFGLQSADTITVNGVAFAPGLNNTLSFSIQDVVGNTRKTSTNVNVVVSPPDIPGQPVAGVVSPTQINWTWSQGIRLCLMAGGGPGQYTGIRPSDGATLVPPQSGTTFNQTGLSANTLYGLSVKAQDAFGSSALTPGTSAYTQAATPTGLSITSVSSGSAVFSWGSANPVYTRFVAELSLDNFTTVLKTLSQLSDNYTGVSIGAAGLQPQTLYYFRVRATNGQASDLSTPGGTLTAPLSGQFNTLPLAPGSLAGSGLGPSSITWSWGSVATATSYTLQSATGTNLVVTGGTSYTVTNLSPNASYGAQLQVTNPSGPGPFGPLVTVFTTAIPPTGTNVTGVTTASAQVGWNPNGNPVGTSFEVQIATDGTFGTLLQDLSATANSIGVASLLPGSTYFTRVRASGFNGSPTPFDVTARFVTNNFGAVSSTAAPATPYSFPSDTVATWHFDETGGTRAVDATGTGHDGAISGVIAASTPAFVAAQTGLGNALSFPGVTGSVMVAANSAGLGGTGDLTVEAWVDPAAFLQVQDAGVVVEGAGGAESFILDVSSANRWRFAVRDGGLTYYAVMSTQSPAPNVWTHLAGVYRSGGSPSLSLYVNGTLSNVMTSAPASRFGAPDSLSVGSRRSAASGYDRPFHGVIDEVHVETSAVTAARIGQDYASAQPAVLVPPSPNGNVRLTIPPNAFGGTAVILISSSPLTVPISITPQLLADGLAAPPTGMTLVPNSVYEIVANVGGAPLTSALGSTVALAIPYPDAAGTGLVDGTNPPIPASTLQMYTLNTAVTRWVALPSTVDAANRRVIGQTPHFSVFALFGPTGIKPNTNEVRLYPRPWKPRSGGRFDSVTFNGRTGLAIDNLTASGHVRIFTLAGEEVCELGYSGANGGTLIWDGTNRAGRPVASGVYFAYVKGDDGTSVVIKFAIER